MTESDSTTSAGHVAGPTSRELMAELRARGTHAALGDLPGFPGSHPAPFLCVQTEDGTEISCARADDTWTYPDERLGNDLHLQECDSNGEPVRIWHGVNAREAVSIMTTYGLRMADLPLWIASLPGEGPNDLYPDGDEPDD